MSLPQNLLSASEEDVRRLIASQAFEGPHLEFKRDLPGADSSAKHELLADVSAFANGSGGDIIFGIEEDGEGKASTVRVQTSNADNEVRRVQDILMSGIEPRVHGIQIHPIPFEGGYVLAVRIPQSWAGPHRVKSNNHFFLREGGRKRQLDVPEIRSLFLRSEEQSRKVRDFRTERIGKILTGELPHKLLPGPIFIVHFIPTDAAMGLIQIDPVVYMQHRQLPSFSKSLSGARINIDGALAIAYDNGEGTSLYSLFFRNGFYEAAWVLSRALDSGKMNLPSQAFEKYFVQLLNTFRNELTLLGLNTEMACMVSLVGADQVELGLDRFNINISDEQGKFDRPVLILPDVILPADLEESQALKPVFDLMWQAAGISHSLNYTQEGVWRLRQ